MKKLYTLLLLCCVALPAIAQVVTVNATGAAGSYKTGNIRNWTTVSRNDGNIEVKYNGTSTGTNGMRRGWAVFNLSGIVPPGATVTAVTIKFNISSTVTTAGTPGVAITGYNGDMSTITTPSTVYANCNSGTAFNTTAWGTASGSITRPFNATGVSFINTAAVAGDIISIGFSTTGTAIPGQIYVITGEGGTATTQPQLQITYSCTGVTGVTATATPNPVCVGASFTLSGAATGAGTYLWSGPSGYSSTDLNPAAGIVGSPSTIGIYTLTAFYPGTNGCGVKATRSVTTTPAPSAITGNFSPCAGAQTVLSSFPVAGGTWTVNSTSGATIAGNVLTAGSSTGTTTVSYTNGGCSVTANITTLDTPSAITLAPALCAFVPTTLTSSPSGGTWTASPLSVATIEATNGIFHGATTGTSTVTYTGTNGCKTTKSTDVTQPPSNTITSSTGSFHLCPSLSLTLSNAVPGGVWSASGSSGTINSSTGEVSGVSIGSIPITYSNSCGTATATVSIDPPPPAITGVFSTCVNATVSLHDAVVGGIWSSSDNTVAAAAAGFGTVTGVTAGTADITYTDVSGCFTTTPFTVNAIPGPITGTASTCIGTTDTLINASPSGTWSSADTFIAKVSGAGVVRGVAAATTTITYTYTSTGCFITRPFTVNPLPVAITGNNIFCETKSDTLYDLSLGGTWSSGSTGIATISPSGVVTGLTGGTAIITYKLPTGCIRTRPVIIHPLPSPVISYDPVTNTLSTGHFYVSYQWYQNGVAISGANSYNLGIPEHGIYSVYVVDTSGCERMSTVYSSIPAGVTQVNAGIEISIQPNPTTGFLKMISPVMVKAVVTTIDGKIVAEEVNAKEMNISNLSNGIYMISLFDESGRKIAVQKIIKQ